MFPVVDKADLNKIQNALEKLPKRARSKVIRQSLRRAAKAHLLPRVKATTPRGETGKLKKTVKVRAMKRSRKAIGIHVAWYGEKTLGPKFYAGFVEHGHRAGKYKWVFGEKTLTRTAKHKGEKTIDDAIDGIGKGIEVEWKKL